MSDLIQLIQEADLAMLEWENCKSQMDEAKVMLELAKEKAEAAKQKFEATLAEADSYGIQRNKLRKIVEERAQTLVASGLLSTPANSPTKSASAKPKGAKSKKVKIETEELISEEDVINQNSDEEFLSEASH